VKKMNELTDVKLLWSVAGGLIAFAVWLIRLEGKVKHIEKVQETDGERIGKAIDKMADTQTKMSDAMNEMRTTLAGVVGYEKGAQEARTKRTR
jgi:hypothetical protein